MRDRFVVDTRDRTFRAAGTVARVVVPRETTLRDAVVRFAVLAADGFATAARVVTVRARFVCCARDATERDAVFVAFARDTVFPELRVVKFVRDDVATGAGAVFAIGAIGSANTDRIDNNVEQTKNAPTSKNTVPSAFLQQSAKLRFFINPLL